MTHLLVTNDFPPKMGGIQSYLWELWRRLPPDRFRVLTTPFAGAEAFDRSQPFPVDRVKAPVLLPGDPAIGRAVRQHRPDLVVLDPALPLGACGPFLKRPYALVLHGAEVAVPGRIPGAQQALAAVVRGAVHLVAAGTYPLAEARHAAGDATPAATIIPPGVDATRFRPLSADDRRAARRRFGLPETGPLVVSISRLVPRKGMLTLLEVLPLLRERHPELTVAIGGDGRQRAALERVAAELGPSAHVVGRVPEADLPAFYGCADVYAMLCRNRWGGLEQEGFGIVFLEAAACGVPQVAGDSGGVADAVVDGETGILVRRPEDPVEAAAAIDRLLSDPQLRARMGAAGRERAQTDLSYDVLAARLDATLLELEEEARR